MSKAFVKEDNVEMLHEYRRPLTEAEGIENYMTLQGYEKLKAEFSELEAEREAKSKQSTEDEIIDPSLIEIDSRLATMKKLIESVHVIDPVEQHGEKVIFGATVTVVNEDDEKHTYKIVGVDETDGAKGKVSWISPIGKALLQAQAGDFVTLETPQKTEELEVRKVEFKPITDE